MALEENIEGKDQDNPEISKAEHKRLKKKYLENTIPLIDKTDKSMENGSYGNYSNIQPQNLIARCTTCNAYLSPSVNLDPSSLKWVCPICKTVNKVPPGYFPSSNTNTPPAELSRSVVDFLPPPYFRGHWETHREYLCLAFQQGQQTPHNHHNHHNLEGLSSYVCSALSSMFGEEGVKGRYLVSVVLFEGRRVSMFHRDEPRVVKVEREGGEANGGLEKGFDENGCFIGHSYNQYGEAMIVDPNWKPSYRVGFSVTL